MFELLIAIGSIHF